MPPASAANRNGQIALALCVKTRQERPDQILQPIDERPVVGIGLDEGRDLGIEAGERPQLGHVVRVLQEPHVEHQVGLARHAAAIGERHHRNAHAGRGVEREVTEQHLLELVRRERRGIDHEVGRITQLADHAAFVGDAVGHRAIGRHRMGAARFGVAPLQGFGVAIEVEQPGREVGAQPELLHAPRQVVRVEAVGARIDAEGDRRRHLAGAARRRAHEIAEQRQRHVVDRDIAEILERPERGHAAGAGHAGDDHERAAGRGGGRGG